MLKTKGEEEILVQGFMFKIINVLGEKNETEAAKKRDRSSPKKTPWRLSTCAATASVVSRFLVNSKIALTAVA